MKRLIVIGLSALALAACQNESRAPNSQKPSFYVSMADPAAQVDAVMARDMIGAYRGNNGLGRLTLDPDLQEAAQSEADAMARADRPSSADAFKTRLAKSGFAAPSANVSAGYHTLAEAFSGWRESPQHNRVMLDAKATRIGIATAYAPNSKYKVYWVLALAADRR
jgi:uncharacterized protein YkwD